jgi:hypothetical protein
MPVCVSKHMSDIVELKNSICTDESTSDSVARLKLRRVMTTCDHKFLYMFCHASCYYVLKHIAGNAEQVSNHSC